MVENLINDLLDLAKMQKSSFQLNQLYFNLPTLVFNALQLLNVMARQRGIRLYAYIDRKNNLDLIQDVFGDPIRYL
jgi:signal transduction histidine kinase